MSGNLTGIKITALNNIGSNISPLSLIPIVDTSNLSNPITDKANLQIVGNLILSGAGGANFSPANVSLISLSVANAAQPNITSVGNLTGLSIVDVSTLHIPGGYNGYFLQTDGTGNLSWTMGGGSGNGEVGGSNTQVQYNNSGNFGGHAGFTFNSTSNVLTVPGNIVVGSGTTGIINWDANSIGLSSDYVDDNTGIYLVKNAEIQIYANTNVQIYSDSSNNGYHWVFEQDGNLTLPTNSSSINYANGSPYGGGGNASTGNIGFTGDAIYDLNGITVENADLSHGATAALILPPNGNSSVPAQLNNTYGNVVLTSGNTANTFTFIFANDGTLYTPGNASVNGTSLTVGPGANTLNFVSSTLVISDSGSAYVQAAITNVSDIGSADWAAYGHHGNDDAGWVDMGFTSSFFNDPDYTMTGAGDGYVIVQGYLPGQAPAVGGGNLILATGNTGTTKDIIFGTNGFYTGNIFGRISDTNNAFELSRTGSNINLTGGGNILGANVVHANTVTFSDSTSQTTAYQTVKSGFDQQYPSVQMDNIQAAIDNTGHPTIAAITGTWSGPWTAQAHQWNGSNYPVTTYGSNNATWTSLYGLGLGVTFANFGDQVVGYFTNNDAGHIYQVTWIAGSNGPSTGYGFVQIQRLV